MSDSSVRIPITSEVLFTESSLVQFFGGMECVLNLRRAVKELKDASMRDTSAMEEEQRKSRDAVMLIGEKILVQRLEYELDLALAHLENYFETL